jgi:hypothetical protein
MSCRLLGHAEYEITEAVVHALETSGLSVPAATELRTIVGYRMRDGAALHRQLAAMVHAAELLVNLAAIVRDALVEECGKHELYPASVAIEIGGADVPRDQIAAANLATWAATSAGLTALIDPDRGRGKLLGGVPAPVVVRYHYGFPGDIGAGAYDRAKTVVYPPGRVVPAGGGAVTAGVLGTAGSVAIVDSDTYGPVDDVTGVTTLVIEAATRTRPYVRLAGDWMITAAAGSGEHHLVIDGWWIGAGPAPASVVLRGTWTTVTFRHCTLDPGGVDVDGAAIAPVTVIVDGAIDRLVIDHTIASQVQITATGLVHSLDVTDSILQAPAGTPAISLALGMTTLLRTTVFGELSVERLYASETLITEHVEVVDTQTGCFRFSAAQAGSRLPHPFRSVSLTSTSHLFTSRRFGDPGYAQLSEVAPAEIVRGAENGSEIGAWSSLLGPIKEDSLMAKVEEYLPFGLIPSFIKHT